MLAAITVVSQFHRSSLGVIAPELARDLALGPSGLGLAGGMFFIVLIAVQIPIGVAFDWIGPRRLVGALTAGAGAGSVRPPAGARGAGVGGAPAGGWRPRGGPLCA